MDRKVNAGDRIAKRKTVRKNKIQLCTHLLKNGNVNIVTWKNQVLHSQKKYKIHHSDFSVGWSKAERKHEREQEQKPKQQVINNQRACDVVVYFNKITGGAGIVKVAGWNPTTILGTKENINKEGEWVGHQPLSWPFTKLLCWPNKAGGLPHSTCVYSICWLMSSWRMSFCLHLVVLFTLIIWDKLYFLSNYTKIIRKYSAILIMVRQRADLRHDMFNWDVLSFYYMVICCQLQPCQTLIRPLFLWGYKWHITKKKWCFSRQLDLFQFHEDISPLIQEAS